MGILQDPVKALDQIDWYLNHRENEKFPGAFDLAAGNLCRQMLEQILFILCFYSRMPTNRYIKSNKRIKSAAQLIQALDKHEHLTGNSYWILARKKGPRIRKFARYPRTLRKWRRELNEPSHFSADFRRIDEKMLRDFSQRVRRWLDEKDKFLIVTAVNELFSNGKFKATLSKDRDNTPGIQWDVTVNISNLERNQSGGIALRGPTVKCKVISNTEVPRGRWPQIPILVKHSVGINIVFQFLNRWGDPVDISNFERIFQSLARTKHELKALVEHLTKLGFDVSVKDDN